MSGLGSHFLEVSAHALLKGATKEKNRKSLAFLGYFSEAKMEDYDYSKLFFSIILERSYLVQIHTFWKLVHVLFVDKIFVAIGSSQ